MQARLVLFDRKEWTSEAADSWFEKAYGQIDHKDLREFGNAEARISEAAEYDQDKVIMQIDRYLCRNEAYCKSNSNWGNYLLARRTSESFHITPSAMKGSSETTYLVFADLDDLVFKNFTTHGKTYATLLQTIEDLNGELVLAAAGTEHRDLKVAVRQLTDSGMNALEELEELRPEGIPSYLRLDTIWNDPELCPKLDIYGRGIELEPPCEEPANHNEEER